MSKNRAGRWLTLMAVVAVAAMIFWFSAQEGEDSAKLSNGVTEWVLSSLMPHYTGFTRGRKLLYLRRVGLWVRKAAHFSEYALLGLTLTAHLYCAMRDKKPRRIGLIAWLTATLYAVTDEWHQSFVGGRGSAALDVGIDSAGAVAGTLLGLGLIALWHRYRNRRRAPDNDM